MLTNPHDAFKGKGTWYSATYNPGQWHFTTSEVAADWHWCRTAAQASGSP